MAGGIPPGAGSIAERARPFGGGLPGVAADERPQLGRNLTYGLLDLMGSAIVAGHFDERPFPVEAELAGQHGVSLAVTREAVKMLTAKGLLGGRPRQGTFVQPTACWSLFDTDVLRWLLLRRPSVEVLRQFNQLRVAIEPEAAALAARCAQPEDLQRIAHALERLEAPDLDQGEALDAEIGFHASILQASRNPFYARFREAVGTALRISNRYINRAGGGALDRDAYAAVCRAILSRDCGQSRSAAHDLIIGLMARVDLHCHGQGAG